MRTASALALVFAATLAHGQEAAPPSERVCTEFRATMDKALAGAPSSLEINNLLLDAARKGCLPALIRLLEAGASPLARDREGDTALAAAARAGRGAVVEALLSAAKPEERRQIDMPDARGSTPLMLAIHNGRRTAARMLLTAGARVDAANAQGEMALSEAAYAADEDLADLLLQKGARPDTVDRYGKSPICYAAARGASRLVGRLIEAGVDPNARYGGQLTALMWAAGYPDITPADHAAATVRLLIARHANLDLVDDRGRSALMIAAALNRFETARALLEAGADKGLHDIKGKSAADLAATDEMRALTR